MVEVAFDANIALDSELLANDGSIAAYATGMPVPTIPFWPLVFKNVRIHFLGSDDFAPEAKAAAARDINALLESGWPGFAIEKQFPLAAIAEAHEFMESRRGLGRVIVTGFEL